MSEEIVHILTIVSGESGELLDLAVINNFDLKSFCEQFGVPPGDPEMLDKYSVGPDDADFVRKALGREIDFDFSSYGYFIEAARRD